MCYCHTLNVAQKAGSRNGVTKNPCPVALSGQPLFEPMLGTRRLFLGGETEKVSHGGTELTEDTEEKKVRGLRGLTRIKIRENPCNLRTTTLKRVRGLRGLTRRQNKGGVTAGGPFFEGEER